MRAGGSIGTRGWCENRPLKPQSCSLARCRIRWFRVGCTAKRPRYIARLPRRDGRVAEGARLESVYTGNRIVGSNPTPSARSLFIAICHCP